MTDLVLSGNPGKVVALPITLPHIFEKIAVRHKSKVIRVKVDHHALMMAAQEQDVIMASDGKGNFIFPEFQPVVDGMMAIIKLLELLAIQEQTLSEMLRRLPRYHVSQAQVYCLWEAKGSVMRQLNQQFERQLTKTVEGIKITFSLDEWIMVLPSQDQPYIEVIAEATTQARCDYLVENYTQMVRDLQPDSTQI